MTNETSAFGIDFGTTHTRIVYYDNGHEPLFIPVMGARGNPYQIPSLVRYIDGQPVEHGHKARENVNGHLPPESIKWLLDRDDDQLVSVGGELLPSTRIAADFFAYLRTVVKKAGIRIPLDRAAFTVPVKFPPRARKNLLKAARLASIEISHLFPEPVAALYAVLATTHDVSGIAAVFDWGGGTLDIATIRLQDNVAHVGEIGGLKRGGEDFDKLLCRQAVNAFLQANPEVEYTADAILENTNRGQELRLLAEMAKIKLSTDKRAPIDRMGFFGDRSLQYNLSRDDFESWIRPDVEQGLKHLEQALKHSRVSKQEVSCIILSGGTTNIPLVQSRLQQEYGTPRVINRLKGKTDLGNATALGAALLAMHGAKPVFAKEIGVRLAGASHNREAFFPVFRSGEPAAGQVRKERFFLTDTATGVARLLVCERSDPEHEPQGRLLRILPVPIAGEETWVDVQFSMEPYLTLRVAGSGVRVHSEPSETMIDSLSLGYELPTDAVSGQIRG